MVLKLYGSPFSTCTQPIAIICHEKRIPFEFIVVDVKTGEHKTAAYLEKHPFGQIPYIDDDGFILFEGRAICRYLCAKYPDQGVQLLPKDLKSLALMEQGVSIEGSNWEGPLSSIVGERFFKPIRGLTTNEDIVADRLAIFKSRLAGYELLLGKQKYIAGDELTLADLFHIPYGALLPKAGVDIDILGEYPNTSRWWKDITSRPSWITVSTGIKSVASFD